MTVLDGVIKDRGVGRQPGDRELVDIAGERAAGQQSARDVVQPEALSEVVQLLCGFHIFFLSERGVNLRSHHQDGSPDIGLCQPPSAAMSASACFGPQLPALVRANPVMVLKDRINHRPGGLDRVLAGEERSVAGHRVAQQPLVGRFLSRLFIQQVELALVADEFLARALDASGEGDGRVGREPEAQIVGAAGRRR